MTTEKNEKDGKVLRERRKEASKEARKELLATHFLYPPYPGDRSSRTTRLPLLVTLPAYTSIACPASSIFFLSHKSNSSGYFTFVPCRMSPACRMASWHRARRGPQGPRDNAFLFDVAVFRIYIHAHTHFKQVLVMVCK